MRREVDDALDFLFREFCVWLQTKHDRRRRRLLVFLVEAILRQDDVDACLLDGIDLLDRARELALKCLQVIDLVLEFRDAQLAVIKDFKALLSVRQAFRREVETCRMNILRRNEDRRPLLVLLHLIRDFRFLQLSRYLAGVLRLHVREQRHHIRLAAVPHTDADYGNEHGQSSAKHDVALTLAVLVPEVQVALFPVSHDLNPFNNSFYGIRADQTCMRMIS